MKRKRRIPPLLPPAFNPVKPREYGATKAVVCKAFKQAGGVKRVAAFLDLGPSATYGFTDPDAKGCDLSLDRARRLAYVQDVTAFAEDFCAIAGGVFLSPEHVMRAEALADLGGDMGRSTADVIAALLAALRDGDITAQERLILLARTDAALANVVALRGRLMDGAAA